MEPQWVSNGVELEERYCEVAARLLDQALREGALQAA